MGTPRKVTIQSANVQQVRVMSMEMQAVSIAFCSFVAPIRPAAFDSYIFLL